MPRTISRLGFSRLTWAAQGLLLLGILAAGAKAEPSQATSRQSIAPSSQPGATTRAQSATRTAPASRPSPASAPAGDFLREDSRRPLITRPEGSTAGMTWTLLASLLVVLVLGLLVYGVVKRLLPKLGVKVGRRVRVLETSYLGPRKAIHLLQVGSQRFLIGSTRERITMLSEVTLAFLDDEDSRRALRETGEQEDA